MGFTTSHLGQPACGQARSFSCQVVCHRARKCRPNHQKHKISKQIHKRFATVICNISNRKRDKLPKPIQVPRDSLQVLAINSRHTFDERDTASNHFRCLSSCQKYSKNAQGVRHFLKGICVPRPSSACASVSGIIAINGISTHPSHKLYHREG